MASPREDGELQETSSSSEEESDDEANTSAAAQLKFKNDGSFLEMFKKMQESSQLAKETNLTDASENAKDAPAVESSPDTDNGRSASSAKDAPGATQPVKKPGLMSIVSPSPVKR